MKPTGWALDEKDNQGHAISVVPGHGSVTVKWGCSSHSFTDPAEMVSNMEKVIPFPDVWLVLRTIGGEARYVRIEGGRLHADQNNPSDYAVNCDYEDFKAALLAAANSDEERKGMT